MKRPGARAILAAEELRLFGQETFERAASLPGLDDPGYKKALATCRKIARDDGVSALMKTHRLDALVTPTAGPAWIVDLVTGDTFTGATSTLAAVSGCPTITLPAGQWHGLPLGVSLVADAWEEAKMIGIAHALEAKTRARTRPPYAKTLPFQL